MKKYTANEWMELEGFFAEDMNKIYPNAVAFYADEESYILGCEYEDGTFGISGCGQDMNGLTYEQMIEMVAKGKE